MTLTKEQKAEAKKSLHQYHGTGGAGYSMVYGDGIFANSLTRRYGMSISELEIASGYRRAKKPKPQKRPGYRETIDWIAHNDDADLGDEDEGGYIVSVVMTADLWGKSPAEVARAVERVREKEA
jgi:hypothetical protein